MSILNAIETGDSLVRVEPPRATLDQLQIALSNRMELVRVDRDVLDVARRLQSIDPGLVLEHDERQNIFVLFWQGVREVDGRACVVEDIVGAYTELDARIISLIERLDAQGRGRNDLQRELDKLERQKDAENEWRFQQQIGDASEHLRHALRKDLNAEGSSVQLTSSRGIHRSRRDRERIAKAKAKAQRAARKKNR